MSASPPSRRTARADASQTGCGRSAGRRARAVVRDPARPEARVDWKGQRLKRREEQLRLTAREDRGLGQCSRDKCCLEASADLESVALDVDRVVEQAEHVCFERLEASAA